jgi:nicotinate-nucleotide--dimethylbenzimidazole phosphoribosyltransferase
VDDRGMQKKLSVIGKALEVNRARLGDPLGALAAVGGLEIAGICGLILGAAACHIPVAVDGFISTAGAAVAMQMNPAVRDYLFFCHLSDEKGHRAALQKLGVEPILDLHMRLGEGTGAAMAMSLIEAAVKIYNQMATFGSAGVSEKGGK